MLPVDYTRISRSTAATAFWKTRTQSSHCLSDWIIKIYLMKHYLRPFSKLSACTFRPLTFPPVSQITKIFLTSHRGVKEVDMCWKYQTLKEAAEIQKRIWAEWGEIPCTILPVWHMLGPWGKNCRGRCLPFLLYILWTAGQGLFLHWEPPGAT